MGNMFKRIWAMLMGDTVRLQAEDYHTGKDFPRYKYSERMIEEINGKRRYQILCNRSQTEIYVIDTLHKQRVGRFYDISYALIVADTLNEESGQDQEI